MEVRQINQLMVAMGRYGISKLTLKSEGVEIQLERGSPAALPSHELMNEENPLHGDFAKRRVHGIVAHEAFAKTEAGGPSESPTDPSSLFVDSPMVGTVYLAPAPGETPFVKVGDTIHENTVVCLVEAMKVMNEVKAGVSGVVAEILMENSQPVEYGTRLFRVVSEK